MLEPSFLFTRRRKMYIFADFILTENQKDSENISSLIHAKNKHKKHSYQMKLKGIITLTNYSFHLEI